jgi:hypothetical protein
MCSSLRRAWPDAQWRFVLGHGGSPSQAAVCNRGDCNIRDPELRSGPIYGYALIQTAVCIGRRKRQHEEIALSAVSFPQVGAISKSSCVGSQRRSAHDSSIDKLIAQMLKT